MRSIEDTVVRRGRALWRVMTANGAQLLRMGDKTFDEIGVSSDRRFRERYIGDLGVGAERVGEGSLRRLCPAHTAVLGKEIGDDERRAAILPFPAVPKDAVHQVVRR